MSLSFLYSWTGNYRECSYPWYNRFPCLLVYLCMRKCRYLWSCTPEYADVRGCGSGCGAPIHLYWYHSYQACYFQLVRGWHAVPGHVSGRNNIVPCQQGTSCDTLQWLSQCMRILPWQQPVTDLRTNIIYAYRMSRGRNLWIIALVITLLFILLYFEGVVVCTFRNSSSGYFSYKGLIYISWNNSSFLLLCVAI